MAITQCDQCQKDIIKAAFCSTNCRVKHFRHIADKKTGTKRPPAMLIRPRFIVEKNEYGQSRNGPGYVNPAYTHETGYDEAAEAIEL